MQSHDNRLRRIQLYLEAYTNHFSNHIVDRDRVIHAISVLYAVDSISIGELIEGVLYIEGEDEVEVRSTPRAPKLQLIITI